MSFPVSVRNMGYWERCMNSRQSPAIGLPEVVENSRMLQRIVPHARAALPVYAVNPEEIELICDSVAYLVRTDVLKANASFYGQMLPPSKRVPRYMGEDGSPRLLHDPKDIGPGFRLRNTPKYNNSHMSGAEWFRCFAATFDRARHLIRKLYDSDNSMGPAFVLADVVTFLIDPAELIDYTYTPEESAEYEQRLTRTWEEI